MIALPPMNGRPLLGSGGLQKHRNLRTWTTIKNRHEGHIEFWHVNLHIEAEYIRAEDAIELASRTRYDVLEIIADGSDPTFRDVVDEAVSDLRAPGHEDNVVQFLKYHRDRPGATEIEARLFDNLIDDYRDRVATGQLPAEEDFHGPE